MSIKKKLPKLLPLLFLLALGSSIVFAVIFFTRPLASTITFIANDNIQLYNEVGCTTIMTAWDLGSLRTGQTAVKTVYVKAIYVEASPSVTLALGTIPVSALTMSLKRGGIAWDGTQSPAWGLAPGSVADIEVTMTVGTGYTNGAAGFTINFNDGR